MLEALKGLRLVAQDDLILHEAHDERRLARLRERLREESVQRNPVIVSPCDGGLLVLDGAHRVHATRETGHALLLAQLTRMPETPESWSHVLAGARLDLLGGMGHLRVSEAGEGSPAARLETAAGETLGVYPVEEGLEGEVRALCEMQGIYPGGDVVRRVDPASPVELGEGEVRILYRTFAPAELVELVRSGQLLPAGITRFRVRERVLGVRYPLERMRSGDPEARNAELRDFVQEYMEANRVRRYDEPVVVFE